VGDAVAWLAGAVNRFSSDRGEDLKHYQKQISRLSLKSSFLLQYTILKDRVLSQYYCFLKLLVTDIALAVMRT